MSYKFYLNKKNIYKREIILIGQEVLSQQSDQVTGWTTQVSWCKARINGTEIFVICKVSKQALKHIMLPI